MDLFMSTPFVVEVEIDLSVQQQLLDILVIRKTADSISEPLPDGLDNLAEYNLLTYKSRSESLDARALDELLSHEVAYRKLVSPRGKLLPIGLFQMYGLSTRFPTGLHREVPLNRLQEGVYYVIWGTQRVRILVLSEMPETPPNAVWEMFSGEPQKVAFGLREYRPKSPDLQGVFGALSEEFGVEGSEMSYTIEDFRREVAREHLKKLPPKERLEGLTPEDRLEGLTPEDRLEGLTPDEVLRKFSPGERLEGLPLEEIEAYLRSRKTGKS